MNGQGIEFCQILRRKNGQGIEFCQILRRKKYASRKNVN